MGLLEYRQHKRDWYGAHPTLRISPPQNTNGNMGIHIKVLIVHSTRNVLQGMVLGNPKS
jgi:hypothetical protein